jgi:hypothetical protein
VDIFRACHPLAREYTFRRPGLAPSRLDRAYVPPALVGETVSVWHVATTSDHSALCASFRGVLAAGPPPPPQLPGHTGSLMFPSCQSRSLALSSRLSGRPLWQTGHREFLLPCGGMPQRSRFSGIFAPASPR